MQQRPLPTSPEAPMRVTVEVDRHCVTYYCAGCRAQLDWTNAMPANAGTSFVMAHRLCEDERLSETGQLLVAPLTARVS
jgi:hypothetical protein